MRVTDVSCARCGAKPGEKCRSLKTGRDIAAINSHADRYHKLRAKERVAKYKRGDAT